MGQGDLSSMDFSLVAVIGFVCQILALVVAIWLAFRVDRHLRVSGADLGSLARRCDDTLQAILHGQREMQFTADAARGAMADLVKVVRSDIPAVLDCLTGFATEQANAKPAPVASVPAPAASVPASGADPELLSRLADRERQLRELKKERSQLVESTAHAAGLKAMNDRMQIELRQKTGEVQRLQASLNDMTLEIGSLRLQVAGLGRQLAADAARPGAAQTARLAPGEADRLRNSVLEETKALFERHLSETRQANAVLKDKVGTLEQDLERTLREKNFIENYYLELAEAD